MSPMEEEEIDATGDIDTSGLDEEPDEDELEDEEGEELSKKDELIKKISEKLPFLNKLLKKNTADSADEDDEDEEEADVTRTRTQIGSLADELEDESEEQDVESPAWAIKIKEKVPSLEGPISKIEELLNKRKKKTSKDGNDDEGDADLEDGEEGAKPKRQIKIVHIIVVLGLGLVVLYPSEDENTPKKQPVKKQVNKKQVKNQPKKAKPKVIEPPKEETKIEQPKKELVKKEDPKKETKEEVTKKEDTSKNAPKDTTEEFDLGEDLDITETPDNSESTKEENTKTEAQNELDSLFEDETPTSSNAKNEVEEPKVEDTMEEPSESDTEVEVTTGETLESNATTEDMLSDDPPAEVNDEVADEVEKGDEPAPSDSLSVDDSETPSSMGESPSSGMGESTDYEGSDLSLGDQLEDEIINTQTDNSAITDNILEKLEVKTNAMKEQELMEKATSPTDPPEYINPGAALVYNCVRGHWACVDVVDYQTCESNYAWNFKQAIKTQCYPMKVFQSEDDCIALQQYKIDSVAKTDFCN